MLTENVSGVNGRQGCWAAPSRFYTAPSRLCLTFPRAVCIIRNGASVLEQADNRDLKSCALWACGFDPRHSHKKTSAPETASGGRFFGYAPNTFFGEQREESAECRLDSFYYISFADSYFTTMQICTLNSALFSLNPLSVLFCCQGSSFPDSPQSSSVHSQPNGTGLPSFSSVTQTRFSPSNGTPPPAVPRLSPALTR